MNICGCLVHVATHALDQAREGINAIAGAEIHAEGDDGRLVVVVEDTEDSYASDQIMAMHSRELLERVAADTQVVGIDEGQFFDLELPAVCNTLADQGKRVIVAGLDQDYLGKPFEPMPQLLAIAEYITKTLAICMVCGEPANNTQRLVQSRERVLVGAQNAYEARCRACFDPTLSG